MPSFRTTVRLRNQPSRRKSTLTRPFFSPQTKPTRFDYSAPGPIFTIATERLSGRFIWLPDSAKPRFVKCWSPAEQSYSLPARALTGCRPSTRQKKVTPDLAKILLGIDPKDDHYKIAISLRSQ